MKPLVDLIQTADWKTEKHVPVIESPDKVKPGELFSVNISVGKEIPHPNTTEHHISWISLYFIAEGEKFIYEVGHYDFSAHGQSPAGPNQGPIYTSHTITTSLKINKSGVLYSLALCNIHGLWQSTKQISIS